MTKKTRLFVALMVPSLVWMLSLRADAQVNLREFVKVTEVISTDKEIPLADVMDKRHNVRIAFQTEELKRTLRSTISATAAANTSVGVKVRVEARLQHNNGQPLAIPVDNYGSVKEEVSTAGVKSVSVTSHDKPFELTTDRVEGGLPEGYINLTAIGVDSGDRLYITITDVKTQSGVNYVVSIGEYDWNLKISDTFLLLKRLNVSKAEEAEGEKPVNFRPAPGVTFGYIYSGRKGIKKVLSPGFGYNVSFTDWNDPAFDISTGMFAKGTDASKVEITTGPIFSLFNNTLHFTYGWNLNARSDRKYWGIGFSFFNLSQKIAGLIKQ